MARSFSVSGTGTVKTGTYGNPKNAGYIKVTGATFDESTGKIGINYEYGVYQTTADKSALVAAVAVAFGGSLKDSGKTSAGTSSAKYKDQYMCHGYGTVTSQRGSNWVSSKSYSANSYNKASGGTYTIDKVNSITYGVKAQMGQGWGWSARWNATSHPGYPKLTGGTLTFTFPQYDITYNLNGGSGTFSTQVKDWGTAITLHSGSPSKSSTTATGYKVTFDANGGTASKSSVTATDTTNYTFSGWKDSGGTSYGAGTSYTTNAGLALTANYSSSTTKGSVTTATATKSNTTSTRTVTFNANTGSCNTSSLNSTATTTYSCNGWYTAKSGGTKRASSGGSYTPSAAETVYAQWSSSTGSYSAITLPTATKTNTTSTRTVTFDATTNSGSCSTASLNSTSSTTHTFNGWYTATSGGTLRGKAGASYTPSASETVYAQFTTTTGSFTTVTLPTASRTSTTNTRTITYNTNGGECVKTTDASTSTTSYSLNGWFTSATGGTNRGKAGATYTPSASEKLYAQFGSTTSSYSSVTLPTPTKQGYKFMGWSTSSTATTGITGSYTPASDVTLYATWERDLIGCIYIKINGSWQFATSAYSKANLLAPISFTVDNVSYSADKGMTWGEWVESDYSGGAFEIDSYNEIKKVGTSTMIAYRETPESDYTFVKSDDIVVARDYSLRK